MCILFSVSTDGEPVKLSKYMRQAQSDPDLETNLKYTFIEDNHTFQTEGATLKYVE